MSPAFYLVAPRCSLSAFISQSKRVESCYATFGSFHPKRHPHFCCVFLLTFKEQVIGVINEKAFIMESLWS